MIILKLVIDKGNGWLWKPVFSRTCDGSWNGSWGYFVFSYRKVNYA
jgi:hypothetical protein